MTKQKNNKKTNLNRKKNENSTSFNTDIKSIVRTIVILLIILVVFYLITVVILNKKSTLITNNASIQYTKILAGESFNQKENDYLVFFYDMSNDDASNYADLISKYREKDKHLTIYTVDMNEGLNKKYVSDESENREADSAKDLKIKDATLIRFKNNSITEYVTSSFDNYLNNNVE